MESLNDAMDRVQKEYEAAGLSFYSRSKREKISILVMFHVAGEGFTILIFDNEQPWNPEGVRCFIGAAKSKAEAFGTVDKAQTN